MGRKSNGLSGVYTYRYQNGILEPMLVTAERDEAGVLEAHFALIDSDRKTGATRAGMIVDDIDVAAVNLLTFAAVARAARKSRVPVVLGRPVEVNPRSRFGIEMARLTETNVAGIILAPWRVEKHDAKKAGFTLKQLNAAVRRYYAQ